MQHSSPSMPAPVGEPTALLRQLIMGFRTTQMIYVAAELGLADELRNGPLPVEQLAQIVLVDAQALYRLLRALASLGLFAEVGERTFTLTPLAQHLRSDSLPSLRNIALLYGAHWLWQAYGQMLFSVRAGRQAFGYVHGEELFAYLEGHPAAAAQFHGAMSAFSALESAAILAAYDFAWCTTVVDVGGGHGALLAALLRANPKAAGVLFDLPKTAEEAQAELAKAGLAERTSCMGGSFFDDVPVGGDLYVLKSVLHNWNDAECSAILSKCRQSMGQHPGNHARLLIIERLVPEGNDPSEAKLFDINMLVVIGGQERTEREYRHLLETSGLKVLRVMATQSPLSIIEAA